MLRTTILFIIICALSIPLWAQDIETRDLKSFNKIKVANGILATIIEGSTNEINIAAEGVVLDQVKSSVSRGELVVKLRNQLGLITDGRIDVEVTITYSNELRGIYANSGASINAKDNVTSNNLELKATSGASLDLPVSCGDIKALVSSGGEIDIQGKSRRLELRFNTGSSFRGFNLQTQKARVKGGTGGIAEISVSEYIKTNVNTGASIEYRGNPSKKDINKGTGGEVRHRPETFDSF